MVKYVTLNNITEQVYWAIVHLSSGEEEGITYFLW
jgi:hypothetical protein